MPAVLTTMAARNLCLEIGATAVAGFAVTVVNKWGNFNLHLVSCSVSQVVDVARKYNVLLFFEITKLNENG